MRQAAIDAFNSIQTPELKDLQVQLDKYVQAGQLTPEQAEAELLKSNAFNDIVTDPSLVGAQKQALTGLQKTATSGGLTAVDKARMQDVTDQQEQEANSRNAAIMSNAKERGVGGSDLTAVNQLMNEQGAADRAARRGTDVASQAQTAALQALMASGQLGGQMEGQQFGEGATKANAANAIDLFNKQTLNQTNLYNVDAANKAQAANLANSQAISNANTGTSNSNKEYNANAVQQQYDDAMKKASGIAGVDTQWANAAQDQKNKEMGADLGMWSAIANGATKVATAGMGGGAGAAGSAGMESAPSGYSANMAPNQMYKTAPDYAQGYAQGGVVQPEACMKDGGMVPGKPRVAGDSPVNDTVDAKLSPGELVVPRSAMSDDQEFDHFMSQFKPKKIIEAKPKSVSVEVQALQNLHQRLKNLEGGR